MTTIAPNPAPSGDEIPILPDLSVITAGDTGMAAALYIDAGFYVLPVDLAAEKHPGSIVGRSWPDKSSQDAQTVCNWWTARPGAGIAVHTGASGITAFDIDLNTDTLPDELSWLTGGLHQSSRQGASVRGHYVFHTGDEIFTSGDLKCADGTKAGEIRSGNTVIIVAPSPHQKADAGGQYQWRDADVGQPFPALPTVARAYLRPLGTLAARGGVAVSNDAVTQAYRDWVRSDRPAALDNLVSMVGAARSGTRNDTRNALRVAACEARAGLYPWRTAVSEIHSAAVESYRARAEDFDAHIGDYEFSRLVANGVGWALSRTVADITAEANRRYGTHHEIAQAAEAFGYTRAFRSAFRPAFRPAFRTAGRF